MGEELKLVWVEFSTLSWAVLVMRVIVLHRKGRPNLELKTRLKFSLVSISLSTGRWFFRIILLGLL